MTNRRDLLLSILPAFAVVALVREARSAVTEDSRSRRWILRQDELARGLADGTLSQLEWHDAVNALARDVDVAELSAEFRRADIRNAGNPFGHDPQKRFVKFRNEDGSLLRVSYGAALFDFGRDNVITPHAHQHMASAHMVIEGKVRIRTFDRVSDEDGALIIRPSADLVAEPGYAAAMTTAKDNIHWFAPHSERAMTFDVIVDSLDAGQPDYVIQPVDPLGGEIRADGSIRAPLLTFAQSSARYTASL
jgi:hypothetical protein